MTTNNLCGAWLGFDPNLPVHDIEHECTLDELVASMLSDKRTSPKPIRLVVRNLTEPGSELELFVLVRRLTQIFTPMQLLNDPQVVTGYYEFAEWGMEGWIKREGPFSPSFHAPSIRCHLYGNGDTRLESDGLAQFMNQLDL